MYNIYISEKYKKIFLYYDLFYYVIIEQQNNNNNDIFYILYIHIIHIYIYKKSTSNFLK